MKTIKIDQDNQATAMEAEDYLPFSYRNIEEANASKTRIPKDARKQLITLMRGLSTTAIALANIDGFEESSISRAAFDCLKEYYTPMSYFSSNTYQPTNRIRHFIMGTSPLCILDYIEVFARMLNSKDAEHSLNHWLHQNHLPVMLQNGWIVPLQKDFLTQDT